MTRLRITRETPHPACYILHPAIGLGGVAFISLQLGAQPQGLLLMVITWVVAGLLTYVVYRYTPYAGPVVARPYWRHLALVADLIMGAVVVTALLDFAHTSGGGLPTPSLSSWATLASFLVGAAAVTLHLLAHKHAVTATGSAATTDG